MSQEILIKFIRLVIIHLLAEFIWVAVELNQVPGHPALNIPAIKILLVLVTDPLDQSGRIYSSLNFGIIQKPTKSDFP